MARGAGSAWLLGALLAALAPPAARANAPEGALASRAPAPAALVAMPTRSFETGDLERARRIAVATLQDLGFALESADAESGVIVASRLDAHALRLAVTIAAAGDSQITATVDSAYAAAPVSDPRAAELFLTAYAAALFPPPEID